MNTASETFPVQKSRAVRAILWGALIAGTLDLIYACVVNGLRGFGPVSVMQSIASGLLGREAYQGGAATAALGVALHFFILFVAAAIYYAASRRLRWLTQQPVVSGLLFGIAIWMVMNFVVVPLSVFPYQLIRSVAGAIRDVLAHMFLVGLPIALAVRYSK